MRSKASIDHISSRHHNPHYLSSVYFDPQLLSLTNDISEAISLSDCIIIAVPSAYVDDAFRGVDKNIFTGKKIISAIKGILPEQNLLLNDYLKNEFNVLLSDYFAVLGPCHAEEVAAEKLSYLTFSGIDEEQNHNIAACFKTPYLNTIENHDITGVQFAAVLKNIYALGAGIAHGLEYGDNFLSVFIANSADEMARFLRKAGIQREDTNYAASVYLGDLLVTCYSLYSRNRTFGNMIGKGYSVKAAQLEMNMVAEGYNASRCMHTINKDILADMPIADTVYNILWQGTAASAGFNNLESSLL